MRSMVEGAQLTARLNDPAKHRINVLQDLSRGNTKYVKSLFPYQRIARLVGTWSITEAVGLAVHLNDQSVAKAGEIGRDPIPRKLASELKAARTLP